MENRFETPQEQPEPTKKDMGSEQVQKESVLPSLVPAKGAETRAGEVVPEGQGSHGEAGSEDDRSRWPIRPTEREGLTPGIPTLAAKLIETINLRHREQMELGRSEAIEHPRRLDESASQRELERLVGEVRRNMEAEVRRFLEPHPLAQRFEIAAEFVANNYTDYVWDLIDAFGLEPEQELQLARDSIQKEDIFSLSNHLPQISLGNPQLARRIKAEMIRAGFGDRDTPAPVGLSNEDFEDESVLEAMSQFGITHIEDFYLKENLTPEMLERLLDKVVALGTAHELVLSLLRSVRPMSSLPANNYVFPEDYEKVRTEFFGRRNAEIEFARTIGRGLVRRGVTEAEQLLDGFA